MTHTASTGKDVLAFLEHNHLEPTPFNYRLGYLFVTAGSAGLVKEVNRFLEDKLRIRQADANSMMARHGDEENPEHVAEAIASEDDDPEKREREMAAFAAAAMALVKETRQTTGQLTRDLSQESEIIQSGVDGEALQGAILRMVERSQETEHRLKEASKRIKRLQTDLEEARDTATIDELTGLRNRRAAKQLMERLDAEDEKYSIAVVDIDNFKRINDTFGHPVGDRVIAHVGKMLAETMAPEMVARWGGEEFLVIAQDMSMHALHDRLDDARSETGRRNLKIRETDRQIGSVTFSGGVAVSEGNCTQAVEIADALLYEAKQNGRNQIRSSLKSKAA